MGLGDARLQPKNDDSKVVHDIEANLVEQILDHVARVVPRGEFIISAPNDLVVRSAVEKQGLCSKRHRWSVQLL